jgi:Leucine-rich repeat (LRR) protein
MMPVFEVLESLPLVETIDVSDNRLTDKSLMTLAVKLKSLSSLTHLDLSFNKIDESSGMVSHESVFNGSTLFF